MTEICVGPPVQLAGKCTVKSFARQCLCRQLNLQMKAAHLVFFPQTWGGGVCSRATWQTAHHSVHLNNELLGWSVTRGWRGTWWWLNSACVPRLIWSMLQQSEILAACSAAVQSCQTRFGPLTGCDSRRKARWKKELQHLFVPSERRALITGWEYEVDLQNGALWCTLMLCSPDSWNKQKGVRFEPENRTDDELLKHCVEFSWLGAV